MSATEVYESLILEVCSLDRATMMERLEHFGGIPLDFSHDYLQQCDDDRLRHLLLAALWRCRVRGLQPVRG